MNTIFIIMIALLIGYVIAEAFWTYRVVTPDRRANGQPTLGDIYRTQKIELDLKSSGRMRRYKIRAAIATGGRAALDRDIRKAFTGDYTHWSIDYRYSCYNHSGVKIPGSWTNTEGLAESVIWFYNERTPPKPTPKPEPVPSPKTADWDEERARLEAFKKHPSAFWLNPDWNKARETGQPFWMHDPAPLPEENSVDIDFQELVEFLVYNDMGFEDGLILQRLEDPQPIGFLCLADRTVQVTRKEFREAQRIARGLRGHNEDDIERTVQKHLFERDMEQARRALSQRFR